MSLFQVGLLSAMKDMNWKRGYLLMERAVAPTVLVRGDECIVYSSCHESREEELDMRCQGNKIYRTW